VASSDTGRVYDPPVGGVPAGRGATVSLSSARYMLLSARPFVLVLGLTMQFGCWHRGAAGTVGHRGSGTQGRGSSGSGAGVFWLVMVGSTRVRINRNCCAEGWVANLVVYRGIPAIFRLAARVGTVIW
jgi:hypothetical protein